MNSKHFPPAFTPLPLGAVKPLGWLRDQLRLQADGLTGHLDEFWPDVARSKWIGGDAEGWERGPYWLDGVVPLAVLLDDERLKAKVTHWVDYILTHQHEDGWLGPKDDANDSSGEHRMDPWPLFVLFKALAQWQEATGDERIIPAMIRALRRVDALLDETPLESWAKMRWPDLGVSLHWLYARTGDEWLLRLVEKAQAQGYDWRGHFAPFTLTDKQPQWTLENHVVNHAMALKEPAVRTPADPHGGALAAEWMAMLDRCHGQVTGVFSGDESLAGREPTQGTELCAVVEYMYSLELLLTAFGDPAFGDRLERIAYNALPGTCTPDLWAHQYDQQANQVLCTVAPRAWTNNDDTSNIYGLEPNFGCCTANMHQGWPKLVSHLWMATPEGGLAAVAYGPCVVTARVGDGADVTITEETEYPFRGGVTLRLAMDRPRRFFLRLPIPTWAEGATVQVGEEKEAAVPGTFHTLEREWRDGDIVTFTLPMENRWETREHGAVSILRGPLVFSLRMGEEFRYLKGELPHADWEILPTTPWNYGLVLDGTGAAFQTRESSVGDIPFAHEAPPVALMAPARRLPTWTLVKNSAGPLPHSPAETNEPLEQVELIPYGSTRLRITEFPTVTVPG